MTIKPSDAIRHNIARSRKTYLLELASGRDASLAHADAQQRLRGIMLVAETLGCAAEFVDDDKQLREDFCNHVNRLGQQIVIFA